jgi:2-methylcitrate dehydratase PrpD
MTIARELAGRIAKTSYEDLSAGALRYAKIGLLDTIGVGVAGGAEDAAVIARRSVERTAGAALVWGTGERTVPLEAAFLNGISANVLDFDDCTDNLGASGREILTAYVVGFEMETQLGRGVNFHHYEKGWHPTSTLGVFGAGAAGAKLLGLEPDRTTHTLALCASMAAGVKANLGSMGKPLHIGQASRSGLLAALLASNGFTGNADAFEHHQGFLELFNGAGNYSVERLLEKWGAPWDIEMPGIAIKQYPCCLSTQSAVDLMLRLVREQDIQADQVSEVVSKTSARRLEHTNRPQPRNALDAKLSIQYVLARALNDRHVSLDHFEEHAFKDPAAQRMMKRVKATPSDADSTVPDMGAEITIALKDGRRVSGTIDRPIGHAAGIPLAEDALNAKFAACTTRALGAERSKQIVSAVAAFEDVADVRAFTALLEPAQPR